VQGGDKEEQKPAGRSLLDEEGGGPEDTTEPLPSHGGTEASLHDGNTDHSAATEEEEETERGGGGGHREENIYATGCNLLC